MRLSNGSSGAILGAGGGAGAILGAGEGDLDMKNGDILLIVHNIASLRSLEIMPMFWGWGVVMWWGGGGSDFEICLDLQHFCHHFNFFI